MKCPCPCLSVSSTKSIVKGLKAKLELSEARRVVARAEISLEKAKQVQLEVKHAAELRKLCE